MKELKLVLETRARHVIHDDFYYKSFEDFVFKEGIEFTCNELTEEETKIVKDALGISKSSKGGECFYNAQLLALSDSTKKIEYWEGYTTSSIPTLPILHGFNVINGKIIDVTHKINKKHILGDFGKDKEYIGVKFETSRILEQIKAGKPSVSFIDDWNDGWAVLQNKWGN
ncbi:hypothetical protein [Tenacibaculum retecalamus]|uniref:hypothetical protein n=1 Tax=Tenacibaculum retecalamus TaxID=3018315 RepID=UPI0023D943FA|nr:hypothetical protein [Tenacibaculum retecalamus]WBX70873.1 hypothetical protein PG912_11685 [Tenacibaculum retecalamus]